MDYANKLSTLQERVIIQLAVNLCQRNSFKELVLCLDKPTYGYFYSNSTFVSDEKNYSIWVAKMSEVSQYERRCSLSFHSYVREHQDAALEKEYHKLTEELPHLLRDRVCTWMKRIALEYQSYRCRLELLFGVSRYFLMTFLGIGDWKETGRLDEKKLALRLLEDDRLTVFQKYHIACVYCLDVHIPELWKRLTREEILFIIGDLRLFRQRIRLGELVPYKDYKTHVLVLLWSYQMERDQKHKLTERELWYYAAELATYYGNRAALAMCWERLKEEARQQIIVDRAFISLEECVKKWEESPHWQNLEKLEEISWPDAELAKNVFDLRSHHAELLLFFLSHMDEEQKLTLFRRVFSDNLGLECFLDWPLQHELLRTINSLGKIIPKRIYREFVFTLAKKCSENSTKENHIDDYRNLFYKLWETTPKEVKQYVFEYKDILYSHLLCFLLPRSPFQKDEDLFYRLFSDLSQEDRREMMRSDSGRYFISKLLDQRRWPFLNWLLEECLPKEEIPNLKKKFIKSDYGCDWCLDNLGEKRESFVQDVIDWCFEFDSEKSQFKCEMINTANFGVRKSVSCNLIGGKFAKVERMINFCVSSDERKKEIKVDSALCVCKSILQWNPGEPDWEKMDKILSWTLASVDKIRDIKKYLLYQEGIQSHCLITFFKENWEEVERFYKWFDLSPEEIEDHKNVIFNDRYLQNILNVYLLDANKLVEPLRWFLTNEEKVIRFKNLFKIKLFGYNSEMGEIEPNRVEWLDNLESELLRGLRKEENQNKASTRGTFIKSREEKRSSVAIEDESNSRSKQCKKSKD